MSYWVILVRVLGLLSGTLATDYWCFCDLVLPKCLLEPKVIDQNKVPSINDSNRCSQVHRNGHHQQFWYWWRWSNFVPLFKSSRCSLCKSSWNILHVYTYRNRRCALGFYVIWYMKKDIKCSRITLVLFMFMHFGYQCDELFHCKKLGAKVAHALSPQMLKKMLCCTTVVCRMFFFSFKGIF